MTAVKNEPFLNKLILLFVFDKMEVPLSEKSIEDMCSSANEWLSYMDCRPTISQLLDNGFIFCVSPVGNAPKGGNKMYMLTPNGRMCLASYFTNIPVSTRDQISAFVKKNKNKYRKMQDYVSDYQMNNDGTYTVQLKILEIQGPQLDLKYVVPSRQIASEICRKWQDKAEDVYVTIYDSLVD